MSIKSVILVIPLICVLGACKTDRPVQIKKPQPAVIVRQKHALLTAEQRSELGYPEEIIAKIELAAGAAAEPFFVTILMHTENLKGETGFESRKLAGFSVHTDKADEIIESSRSWLHPRGYLIFKSQKSYGRMQDVVSVIKGRSSYDILKVLGTEAQNYQLDTQSIIRWLKDRQREGTFVVTGAGIDWLEARFINPPQDMAVFANQIAVFAPDVLGQDVKTVANLAERMKQNNAFFLVWD